MEKLFKYRVAPRTFNRVLAVEAAVLLLLIFVAIGIGSHKDTAVTLQAAAQHSSTASDNSMSPSSSTASSKSTTSHSSSSSSKASSTAHPATSTANTQQATTKNIRDDAALKAQLDRGNPNNATMNQDLNDVASDLSNSNE